MTEHEYAAFKFAVVNQRAIISAKQALADEQREVLKTMLEDCPHTELKRESSYYEGSYYDKAYNETWNTCTLCGKCSEKTVERMSYYG
jgi:NAD-dependent dihydropyrimidine dehydrogenase PreA subunit